MTTMRVVWEKKKDVITVFEQYKKFFNTFLSDPSTTDMLIPADVGATLPVITIHVRMGDVRRRGMVYCPSKAKMITQRFTEKFDSMFKEYLPEMGTEYYEDGVKAIMDEILQTPASLQTQTSDTQQDGLKLCKSPKTVTTGVGVKCI